MFPGVNWSSQYSNVTKDKLSFDLHTCYLNVLNEKGMKN